MISYRLIPPLEDVKIGKHRRVGNFPLRLRLSHVLRIFHVLNSLWWSEKVAWRQSKKNISTNFFPVFCVLKIEFGCWMENRKTWKLFFSLFIHSRAVHVDAVDGWQLTNATDDNNDDGKVEVVFNQLVEIIKFSIKYCFFFGQQQESSIQWR